MLRKLLARLDEERGFTLIELLVVILIIGILAAIALPAFLGQRVKSEDASAKSNARNGLSEIETCYVNTQSYLGCDDPSDLGNIGFSVGARGDYSGADCDPPVEGMCVNSQRNEYRVVAKSKSGNLYEIDHQDRSHTCTVADPAHAGGCNTGGSGTTGTW